MSNYATVVSRLNRLRYEKDYADAEIVRLRGLLERAGDALRPFLTRRDPDGRFTKTIDPIPVRIPDNYWYHPCAQCHPTAGDYRRALATKAEIEEALK